MTGRIRRCRFVAALLLAATTILLGAGCAERATDVTVVRFWAMGREGEVVATLLPEFERTHPGIRVEVQQLPWSAAHEKLLTAFAGDATPDICQLGNTWIPEFVALGALEPLDTSIAASSVDPRDFFGGIWDTNVVAGQAYGIPWYVDTRLPFYRRDLLEGCEDLLLQQGLGHVSEVLDGDPPHRPGGTIAQAWNTAEILRAHRMLDDVAT